MRDPTSGHLIDYQSRTNSFMELKLCSRYLMQGCVHHRHGHIVNAGPVVGSLASSKFPGHTSHKAGGI